MQIFKKISPKTHSELTKSGSLNFPKTRKLNRDKTHLEIGSTIHRISHQITAAHKMLRTVHQK
jgi:hypothetical protein